MTLTPLQNEASVQVILVENFLAVGEVVPGVADSAVKLFSLV